MSAPPRLALPHLAPPRRGGTLVLVAVLLTVLVGCAALAVDLARAYGVRTQLRTVADAAALSAATDLARTAPQGDAVARALQLRSGNRVGGTVLGDAGMGAGDVVPGTWDFTAGAFTPSAWAAATAVRATAR
ncbi:MAG: putative Flp pilus-assembly TadE/G-like, partial [Gemmatimonadota bacterium]